MPTVVHLTASTLYGGPERQMLGLARMLPDDHTSVFLSFAEGGRSRGFLAAARRQGFEGVALQNDTPRFRAAVRELIGQLQRLQADVLCCHGYKANLLGRVAARRAGIPALAVSRGWTGETWKVRLYERLDRFHLRWMDRVVCVSEAQAEKVRRCGVRPEKVVVIPNSVDPERFTDPDSRYKAKLNRYFRVPRSRIIGAAGRLSPEKGFNMLIAAAEQVLQDDPSVGFVLFGEGACKAELQQQILNAGLAGVFVLAGFRADLDKFIPHLDLFVQSSFTEGMPNVVLEACAASVPVVATAVGGTPEIIEDGVSGLLCPPGDHAALAGRILDALTSEETLREIGFQGRQRVFEQFSFSNQADGYLDLFDSLLAGEPPAQTEEASQADEPELPAEGEDEVAKAKRDEAEAGFHEAGLDEGEDGLDEGEDEREEAGLDEDEAERDEAEAEREEAEAEREEAEAEREEAEREEAEAEREEAERKVAKAERDEEAELEVAKAERTRAEAVSDSLFMPIEPPFMSTEPPCK